MNSSFLIREIEVDDLDEVFEVRVVTWHNANGRKELAEWGITPNSVATMLSTSHKGWLCQFNSQIVGFAMGDRSTGEMWVIAVLKEFESLGIGRQLMHRVESWSFDHEWREIWLTTDVDESLRAVGFYRHLGWRDWKIVNGDRYMKKINRNV